MTLRLFAAGTALVLAGASAMPAQAQFYFQSRDFAGERVRGDEPGIIQPLPGATDDEVRANLVWSLRAALNVAALQCQFEPTLLTVSNYNAVLKDHDGEFDKALVSLTKYFARVNKTKAAGQKALDEYGTRTYASFGTVGGQFGFCRTAHAVGRDAVFTKRGEFGDVAALRLREIRNSMAPAGEQRFPRYVAYDLGNAPVPRLDAACWNKKGDWQVKKCGVLSWPPASAAPVAATAAAAGTGIAAR